MTSYRVIWEIDVEADNPQEAAEAARRHQIKDGTTALVFTVSAPEEVDHDGHRYGVQIDLSQPDTGRIAPGEFSKAILAGYTVTWDGDDRTYDVQSPDEDAPDTINGKPLAEGWLVTGFKTEREAWAAADNHRLFGVFLAPANEQLQAEGYTVQAIGVNRWTFDNNDYGDLGEQEGVFSYPEQAWEAAQRHADEILRQYGPAPAKES